MAKAYESSCGSRLKAPFARCGGKVLAERIKVSAGRNKVSEGMK